MTVTDTLANNLLTTFEGQNWTEVTIKDTLAGVTWQQATMQTAGSVNTIAGLVHHIAYWNNIIAKRMQGEDPVIPEANGFDMEPVTSEADWQMLLDKAHYSFINLSDEIKNFDNEKLDHVTNHGTATFRKNLFGIVEHAYYHMGQIVILKHLVQGASAHNP